MAVPAAAALTVAAPCRRVAVVALSQVPPPAVAAPSQALQAVLPAVEVLTQALLAVPLIGAAARIQLHQVALQVEAVAHIQLPRTAVAFPVAMFPPVVMLPIGVVSPDVSRTHRVVVLARQWALHRAALRVALSTVEAAIYALALRVPVSDVRAVMSRVKALQAVAPRVSAVAPTDRLTVQATAMPARVIMATCRPRTEPCIQLPTSITRTITT